MTVIEHSPYEKTTENACPFNYLYWDFIGRNDLRLARSCRMTISRRSLERAGDEASRAYGEKSRKFLDSVYANNYGLEVRKKP